MGSTLSILNTACVLAIIGGITYGFYQTHGTPLSSNRVRLEEEDALATKAQASHAGKKGKKKKGDKAQAQVAEAAPSEKAEVKPNVVPFPAVVPGGFDASAAASSAVEEPSASAPSKPKKKKKAKKATSTVQQDAQSESSATAPETTPVPRPTVSRRKSSAAASSLDADGPWTRVDRRKGGQREREQQAGTSGATVQPVLETPTDAGITTSVTGTISAGSPSRSGASSPANPSGAQSPLESAENRRTLAEKLVPKPRKTRVEDMLETPDVPSLARVMRVAPRPDEKPAAGFSWGDYEDVDPSRTANDADGEDEGGWVVKSSKSRKSASRPATGTSTPSTPSGTVSEPTTKKQRQNAAKREAQKAAKAEAEAERLATLAKHKKELEKARIAEAYSSGGGSKKKVGGGMVAGVSDNGKLIWE